MIHLVLITDEILWRILTFGSQDENSVWDDIPVVFFQEFADLTSLVLSRARNTRVIRDPER